FRGSSQQATKVGAFQLIAEGLASDNYNFIYEAGSLIITKRPLNISFHTDSIIEKTYDATATARIRASQLTFGANEKLADDDVYVMLKTGIGEYENERAGSNKTVTLLVTELLLGGQDWDQYAIGNVNNLTTTGRIAKKPLTI